MSEIALACIKARWLIRGAQCGFELFFGYQYSHRRAVADPMESGFQGLLEPAGDEFSLAWLNVQVANSKVFFRTKQAPARWKVLLPEAGAWLPRGRT